ncbi:3-keto-disaccharide hydrolase [Massilia sp. UBA6681]|uniref:3-keto-disaccharide hydrolase n=1 Tax=Massilia sp. UBA6681 TaxID=1946839 RepID=UPI0025B8DFB0
MLFDGKDLREWVSAAAPDQPAGWTVAGGSFTVHGGSGDIQTRRLFTDYQIHLEWRVPTTLSGTGQARGNSGLFLASTGKGSGYEIQILDCADNKTYANGQAASMYKQHIPLVNACAAPGEWQRYDVIWTAPRFGADGKLLSPAYVTALHNGVLVQNHVALQGETVYVGKPTYRKHGPAPILLQDHGDAVSFRNIWVRPL